MMNDLTDFAERRLEDLRIQNLRQKRISDFFPEK